ncbi:MAG: carboxypeptidase-like regulatory domain-containing protein [Bryobacteraceae bacterium]|nr:carboxypeptidase-like regulatory domain-containing protein [Bryobacteraceae bacterium]
MRNRVFWVLMVFAAAGLVSPAAAAEHHAVISGTVFREPGFALPGAEVHLKPEPDPAASKKVKVKAMKAQSDGRGEFAFRVPAAPMRYTVTIRATGYLEEKKTVMIQGEERQDVFATLKTAAREGQ